MEKNNKILQRVRALLAKAESTTFEDEAAALTAKAHELIAAYAIDLALIEEQEGAGEVTTRLIFIAGPYVKEKFILLSGVARGNRSRAILGVHDDVRRDFLAKNPDELFSRDGRYATVVGYSSNLDAIELLFTSLLVQAVNVMLAKGSRVGAYGQNRTRSFRRSFLNSFGWTIRERLAEVRDAAAESASFEGDVSVLPVLASREKRIDEHIDAEFGPLGSVRTSVSNFEGAMAGRSAGHHADIGTSRISRTARALR